MRDGYVKTACATPELRVADVEFNAERIAEEIEGAARDGAKIAAFPELALTGKTCGDLFYSDALIERAEECAKRIVERVADKDLVFFAGMPLRRGGATFDVAMVAGRGKVYGFVPKTSGGRMRQFARGPIEPIEVEFMGGKTPFGRKLLFEIGPAIVGAEIGDEADGADAPCLEHVSAGANAIVGLNAERESAGGRLRRKRRICAISARCACGYAATNAGPGESSSDYAHAGGALICENGRALAEGAAFETGRIESEIDIGCLEFARRRAGFEPRKIDGYRTVRCDIRAADAILTRAYSKTPFLPETDKAERYEEILSIQARALAKRVAHARSSALVLGVSGGLDSALALFVAVRARDISARAGRNVAIAGVVMPCFGTTKRTLDNSRRLIRLCGAECLKISLKTAVSRHLSDIRHGGAYDVAFENAQARERTQALMDIANMRNGLAIGTGDLSESALGWSTYNGDHMSMYSVNCSVPKTLVRALTEYEGQRLGKDVFAVVSDILDTPITPELLPSDGGGAALTTEERIGPYVLHDWFIYHFMVCGFSPSKLLRVASIAFRDEFDADAIRACLELFLRRFFAQQFKRSCMPDGPKVGEVSFSPRGEWLMPSDAEASVWLRDLECRPARSD